MSEAIAQKVLDMSITYVEGYDLPETRGRKSGIAQMVRMAEF